ncbi:MAG TPA: DUF6438 domain-containing protein [Patescibacteria group bacterium]|nr:DUF6438 domain-containing protein [Patescibacteria group bacterium]
MKTSFKIWAILAVLIIAVGVGACNSLGLNTNNGISNLQETSKPRYTRENLQITIERTACFGACPTYVFTIYGDGKAIWEGFKNVKAERTDSAIISQVEIQRLIDVFEAKKFYDLNDRYHSDMVTDLPSTTITFFKEGRRKKVYSYFGAPKEFSEVALAVDQIAVEKGWLER